jgi:hypothetical protein
MAIARKLPIGYYVYTITVDGVVRYIGKGKGLRLYCHMKEVRSRLNRDYRLQNIGSRLQQNLTKAALSGAKVIERVLVDNLTETAAYKLEYDTLREYVFAGKRDQLWNVIPASIQTPQELQAFTERLQRNLNSRDRVDSIFLWENAGCADWGATMNDADCLSATRYSRSTRLTIPTFLAVKGASTRGLKEMIGAGGLMPS